MFEAHGQYLINLTPGNIISIRLYGSFNEQGASEYGRDLKKVVSSLEDKCFKLLIDINEFEGGTPEAFAFADNINHWLIENGMLAQAIVSKSQVKFETAVAFEPHLNLDKTKNFNKLEDAIFWLNNIV